MVNHMSCNYDRQDLSSGAAYTAAVAAMLRHTSDKQPSYDLYCRWLQEGETDAAKNLVMRALAFNQDRLLEEIKKADAAPLDKRAFPTDMVVDFFKDGLAKLPPGGHSAMADLLQSLGGALFKNMDQAINNAGPARRALAAVAAVAGVQFTSLEVTGTRGKFVQHLMQALMQLDPNMKVSANELGKAVATQVRLMEIEGLPVKQTDKRKWLIVLDKAAAQRAGASGKTGAALAAELAKTGLRGVQDLPSLKASAFKAGLAGDAFDAGGTFVVGLVQSFNIVKLVNDYQDQMKHEGAEPLQRLVTAAFAVLGSFGEATGLVLKRAQEAGRLMNAPGRFTTAIPKALIAVGKLLGLVTGVVVAGLDWMKATEEKSKGDTGLAFAYVATGVLGGALAVAFYFSHLIGPIGWLIVGIAVVALLVVTLWIDKNKDNKIQEWLMRCHFGSLPDKYKDYEEESKELKLAFA